MGVVMLFKMLAVAGWAAVASVSSASAQSLGGPAENPPASFKGAQYVDSRGCVFLRAGIGGRVNWVPRVSRDRKALCGPSRADAVRDLSTADAASLTPASSAEAPNPGRTNSTSSPMETIASLPRAAAKPAARASVAAAVAPAVTPAVDPEVAQPKDAPRMQACPSTSPYGARVTFNDGRRSLICSADAGFDVQAAANRIQAAGSAAKKDVAPAMMPAATAGVAAGAGYKCPASAPIAQRFSLRGGGSTVMCTTAGGGLDGATLPLALGDRSEYYVPNGYEVAWQDDRLNPNRAIGTEIGQAQQDEVWTRDVPAKLVSPDNRATDTQLASNDEPRRTVKRKVYATSASNASRTATATAGRMYVQVGTFGDAGNMARSVKRLQGLGLPVAKSRITSKGRNLQIVMAGPFGDAGSAKAALSAARRAGFGDAFIR